MNTLVTVAWIGLVITLAVLGATHALLAAVVLLLTAIAGQLHGLRVGLEEDAPVDRRLPLIDAWRRRRYQPAEGGGASGGASLTEWPSARES
jgi:hypothetical protein